MLWQLLSIINDRFLSKLSFILNCIINVYKFPVFSFSSSSFVHFEKITSFIFPFDHSYCRTFVWQSSFCSKAESGSTWIRNHFTSIRTFPLGMAMRLFFSMRYHVDMRRLILTWAASNSKDIPTFFTHFSLVCAF